MSFGLLSNDQFLILLAFLRVIRIPLQRDRQGSFGKSLWSFNCPNQQTIQWQSVFGFLLLPLSFASFNVVFEYWMGKCTYLWAFNVLSNFPIHYFFVSFHRVGGFAQPPRNNVGGTIQARHAGYHPQQMSTPFPFVPCSLLLRYLILRPPWYWVECEFAHDAKLCSKAPNGFRIGRGAGKVWFGTQSTPGLVHYRIMASFSASHHPVI